MNLTPNSKSYPRTILRVVLVMAALGTWSLNIFGQTTIDFDTDGNWTADGSLTSYANHSYSESGVTIQGTNVLRNTTAAQDGFAGALGTYSMRIGNTSSSKALITVFTGGVSTFSFEVRRWDGSPIPDYTVKYSINGGVDWISLTNINGTLLTSSDWFTYNGTINSGVDDIQIEIANTGTTERIMVDDFTWTDYSTPCAVSITSFSPTSGPPGTVVTISGSGFTGTTSVDFGSGNVAVTEENDGLIYATVPAAATTGVISVTTSCTSSSSGSFSVIPNGVCGGGNASDLFISEYVDGLSGNNKAIEIYNGTGSDVDLSDYKIWIISNGGTWNEGEYLLSGTLVNGDVFVITHSSADEAELLSASDLSTTTTMSFNGDDAVGIAKQTAPGTWSLIDAVGESGADPGTGWSVAGTSNATADHALTRKSSVDSPTIDWTTSAGTDASDSQWIVKGTDYYSGFGSHTFSGGGGSDLSIDTDPIAQTECEGDDATFTVSASASGAIDYQWYWYNDGTSSWDAVSGETSASLTLGSVTLAMDGYQYYCEVTDGSCTLTSNAAMLTVDVCCTAPTDNPTALTFTNITAISMDVDWTAPASGCDGYVVKIGTDVTFTNLIDGTSLPSGDNAPWADEEIVLTGTASTGFTISSLDQNTTYYYKVYPYKLCGSTYKFNNTGLTGSVATLTQSDPVATCADGTLVLTLPISADNADTRFQWQVYNGASWNDVTNTSPYSGATTKELTISPLPQTVNGYMYLCQISSMAHACTTPSASFTVTVNPLPATPIIESVTYNCGETVLTMGTPPVGVAWYWQGINEFGESDINSDLTYSVFEGLGDDTYYLRAQSSNSCWSASSAGEFVTVKEVPVINDFTLTLGCGSGTAYIESSITGEQTFELLDDLGDPLVPPRSVTVTGTSYTFNGIVDGDYTAMVTYNGCSSALTGVGTMSNDLIAGEPTVSDETICGAGTATLSATLGTNATSIEWSLNGIDVVATGLTYDVTLADGETVTVYVRSNNAGGCPSAWEQVNAISTLTVTAPVFDGGLETVHCPGTASQTFTATTTRGTIAYSLDVTSGSPTTPPTINSVTGEVTYNDDFNGVITITATVTGCNGTFTDTHDVTMVKHGTTGIIIVSP